MSDGDGGVAECEGRSRGDRRQQALEPLPCLGQFGGDARIAGMYFGADMMGDEPDDPFAVGRCQSLAGIGETFLEPVYP